MFQLVSVTLYRFRDAQRINRPNDSDRGRDSTPQVVLIPQGAYDIETIIAMLNASDAFPVRIGI